MSHDELSNCFHHALTKAFAARAPSVRLAYFELADFYRGRLGRRFQPHPTSDALKHCLAMRQRAG